MLIKVLKYCKQESFRISAMVLLKLIVSLLTVIQPLIFSSMIDNVLNKDFSVTYYYFGIYILSQVMLIILNYLIRLLDVIVSKNINHLVKLKMMNYLFYIPAYNNDLSQGKTYSLIISDSKAIYSFLSVAISTIFTTFTVIGVGFITLINDWRLTLILIVPYPFIVIINHIFRKIIKDKTKCVLNQNDMFLSMLKNALGNISEIQNQCGIEKIIKAVSKESEEGRHAAIKQGKIHNIFHLCIGCTNFLGNALFTFLGINFVMMQLLTLGDFVAFSSYSKNLSSSLDSLFSLKTNLQPLYVSLERLFELEKKFSKSQQDEYYKMSLSETISSIEIDNVTVSYGTNIIFNNVSLKLNKGEIIGFYGLNGTGKTTLARLIASSVQPSSGNIYINGKTSDSYKYFSLSQHIDYVGANKSLYFISVKDNIMLSELCEKNIFVDVCTMFNIDDYVHRLENGYETVINESIGFSTGQIQKIQIARTFLKQSEVIIFDESMSNLDQNTRKAVWEGLKGLSDDKIIIIISHVMNDYEICDKIYKIANKTLMKVK